MLPEKRYTKTKPSGVEWLGEIPEHWDVEKLKFHFDFSRGLTITKENLLDEGIPCVNYGEIHSKFGFEVNPEIHELKNVSPDYLESSQYALLNKGDFIFADTSEDIKGSGNFTHLTNDIPTFAGYHTITARLTSNNHIRFLAYAFESDAFRNQIRTQVKGVKVFSITQQILKNAYLWLPSLEEQTAIADYLDHKTAYIDRLINKQQTLLNKLAEERSALITALVTGKIDTNGKPTSNLKNSGVEWLGEIPEHWEVKRLKFVGKLQGGTGFPHDYQNIQDLPISFYKVGDLGLSENSVDMPKAQHTIDESITELLGAKIIRDKSILYAKVGAALLLNRRRIVNDICCIDNNMTAFVPNLEKITEKWAFYFLSIIDFGNFVNPGAVPSLSEGYQSNFPFLVPSLEEQTAIADYLDRETAKIDRLRKKIEQSIDKLKEYRSALITNAVTGKIKIAKEHV